MFYFSDCRLLVNPAFPTLLEFEMFDGIRQIRFFAAYSGSGECAVQYLTCRTYEWATLDIFLIARLLSNESHRGVHRAFAENGSLGAWHQRFGGRDKAVQRREGFRFGYGQ